MQNAGNRKNKDKTDGNNQQKSRIIGELAVQHIGKQVGARKRMKYTVRRYGTGQEADIMELPHTYTATCLCQIPKQCQDNRVGTARRQQLDRQEKMNGSFHATVVDQPERLTS